MDELMLQEALRVGLAENFWNDLNAESVFPVVFVDVATCYTTLQELAKSDETEAIAMA